jgi:hypothetical protein
VDDSDNDPFTHHTLFVFFGGIEVGEALAGVSLVSIFFPPLALLIAFGFFVWWRPLDVLSCSQHFLIVEMRLLTVDCHIKVHLDLQADKSSIVSNGPFFPQV